MGLIILSSTVRAVSLLLIAGAIRRCKATSDSRRESLRESGIIGVVFAPVTDLFGICEHSDDSECLGTQRTCPHVALAL